MEGTIGIGVIGCGAIAQEAHLPNYASHPQARLVAVADVDPDRAQEVAVRFGVPHVYSDYAELLARDDIQAVSVCTPNYLHAEQTIAAAAAGKHVLCEKPMAVTLEEADEMIAAADKAGVQLMVGFTHRFYPFNQKARDLIAEGAIGKPYTVRVRFAHRGPYTSWSAKSDWFFDPERAGGGAVLDMGIHALDIARFVLGQEIRTVSANLATLNHDIKAEDTAVISLEFADGTLGYIETGWHSHPGPLGLEIYGARGTIIVDYRTPLRLWTEGEDWQEITDFPLGGGWPAEVHYFVDALVAGRAVSPDGHDGLTSVRAALAAYDSHRMAARVTLA
ncbi:MAG: Gfo/Idh/MocA family oxidoreductase [Anaerolineae bacterium]|nr:Gfo/Idh/MocA family oxidoreductase [Anaerolineae bacterium]